MSTIRLNIETNFSAIQQAESHMSNLAREASQASQAINQSFGRATSSVSNFDNELQESNRHLDALQRNAQTPTTLGRSFAGATKDAKQFSNSLSSMATGFVAGAIITTGLSKISGAFSHAIEVQKQFEKSIQNLSAITGASGLDLEFYKQKAIELGVSVKGGATATVEAFKLIGSAKPELLANKEALAQVTEQAILLSQASGLDLPEAATRLTDAMNQFGAGSEQAGLFVDTLAAAAKFGAAEVPQITEALLKFGAVAKSSNISVQESAAAIELLAEKGLKGSEAGTALRNVLLKLSAVKALSPEAQGQLKRAGVDTEILSDKSKTLQERLTELAKIQGNETALVKVFGTENVVAAKSIIAGTQAIDGHLPRLKELTDQIGKQGFGVAAEQAAKNMDTLDQALIEAGNQYDNFLLGITKGNFGKLIKDYVKSVGESLGILGDIFKGDKLESLTRNVQDKFVKGVVDGASENKKKLFAVQTAYEIKSLNAQLKYNKSLSFEQIIDYKNAIAFKSRVVGQLVDLDKKKVAASKQIVAGDPDSSEERIADLKKKAAEYKKLKEDLTNALLDLAKRAAKAEIDILSDTDENKIKKAGALSLREFEELKKYIEHKGKLVNSNFKFSAEQEKQFGILKQQINQDTAEKLLQLEAKKAVAIAEQRKHEIEDEKKFAELKIKLITAQVNAAPNELGVPEQEFELLKQRVLLQIKKKGAEDSVKVTQDGIKAESDARILALENEFKALENSTDKDANIRRGAILDNIDAIQRNTKVELEVVVAETADATTKIAKEINDIDKKIKKTPFSLIKFLGLNNEAELKQLTDSFSLAVNEVGKALSEAFSFQQQQLDIELASKKKANEEDLKITDEKIKASEDLIAQRQKEKDDLETKLNEAKDLQEEGLANNLDKINAEIAANNLKLEQAKIQNQQAIAEEKALKDKLLADEKRIALEKQKLAREQLLIDTLVQGSNLVTAITGVIKSTSTLPQPGGLILGGITIAAMVAGFLLSKATALAAINKPTALAEGVYDLKRGKNPSGRDTIPAMLDEGESVMRAEITQEHGPLLKALHEDNKTDFRNALITELLGTGVTISKTLPAEINAQKTSIRNSELKLSVKTDNSGMEKRLDKVETGINKIVKQGQTKTTVMDNGDIYITTGNNTKIIRAKR